jgi:hypothetical protein
MVTSNPETFYTKLCNLLPEKRWCLTVMMRVASRFQSFNHSHLSSLILLGLANNFFRQKWLQNKPGVSISESQEEVKVPILHFELGASTSHFRVDCLHDGLHEESMRRVKSK